MEKIRHHFNGRKLYRDPSDKVFGGVCSGFAKYFDFGEPWMWRLALVLLIIFKGVGLLVYLLLWLIVPLARTPEDRVRMEGRPLTQGNLNEQIINESNAPQSVQNANDKTGCLLGGCLLLFIAPIFLGIILFIGITTSALGGLTGGMFWGFSHLGNFIASGILIFAGLTVAVVFIVKAVKGNFKQMGTTAIVILTILMLACLGFGTYYSIQNIRHFNDNNIEEEFDPLGLNNIPLVRINKTITYDDTIDTTAVNDNFDEGAENQYDDAEQQMEDAQQQMEDAKQQIRDAKQQIKDAKQQIKDVKKMYKNTK